MWAAHKRLSVCMRFIYSVSSYIRSSFIMITVINYVSCSAWIYICEICLRSNGTGVTNKQFISIPNNKLHGFAFSVIPLESNALFHPSMPRLYALLEWFFWAAPQLHRYGPLDGLHAFKTGPLDDPLELGEKKKVARSKIRWIGRLFQYGDVLLGQELPDAQGIVIRCIVVVKQPGLVLPQLSSLLAPWAKQKLQDLFVNLLIDRLALWQEPTVDHASHIEERDQRDFDFWFWLSCFLRPRQRRRLPLTSLALGFRVVLKNPCLSLSLPLYLPLPSLSLISVCGIVVLICVCSIARTGC